MRDADIFRGLKWPKNAMRHTFCTMLMSLHGDATKVANRSRILSLYQEASVMGRDRRVLQGFVGHDFVSGRARVGNRIGNPRPDTKSGPTRRVTTVGNSTLLKCFSRYFQRLLKPEA
jgi:hypothetical protein